MSKHINIYFLIIVTLLSCSTFDSGVNSVHNVPVYKKNFELKDGSGVFNFEREVGLDKKTNNFVTKYQIKDKETGLVLERGISLSRLVSLSKTINTLRPKQSQYQVWFEKKLYQVKMSFEDNNLLIVKMKSPEVQWRGEKRVKIPKGNGVYCFYSQIMACAKRIGFIKKSLKSLSGKMKFSMIWDGYPYVQEQYVGVESSPWTAAELVYDGKNGNNEHRFSLNFKGHSVYYFIDKKKHFLKSFWPVQGLSINPN